MRAAASGCVLACSMRRQKMRQQNLWRTPEAAKNFSSCATKAECSPGSTSTIFATTKFPCLCSHASRTWPRSSAASCAASSVLHNSRADCTTRHPTGWNDHLRTEPRRSCTAATRCEASPDSKRCCRAESTSASERSAPAGRSASSGGSAGRGRRPQGTGATSRAMRAARWRRSRRCTVALLARAHRSQSSGGAAAWVRAAASLGRMDVENS
mmetsp:Transcript_91854/g.256710  ORF Transcript_91854/g.256710 Transcript_91854/m.256710 type:complete len:212 (-) Transcript_91854:71-706(-)